MLFRRVFHSRLVDGSITLSFRRWKRPQVRVGGQYRLSAAGVLEVDALERVPASAIGEGDARLAGFDGRASLLAELGRGARGALGEGETLYRVAFHYVERPDERVALAADDALSADEVAALAVRLARMDARSRHGSWTARTLALIRDHPRVVASQLAGQVGRETAPFKADVRKLKRLGLTISHDPGYELSPRGRAFLSTLFPIS